MLTIMGGISEFEPSLIRKRCQDGIDRAKARRGFFFVPAGQTQARSGSREPTVLIPIYAHEQFKNYWRQGRIDLGKRLRPVVKVKMGRGVVPLSGAINDSWGTRDEAGAVPQATARFPVLCRQ